MESLLMESPESSYVNKCIQKSSMTEIKGSIPTTVLGHEAPICANRQMNNSRSTDQLNSRWNRSHSRVNTYCNQGRIKEKGGGVGVG